MATIIEVHESKIEHLAECAEKVMKYGKKMMECLEEMEHKGSYSERSPYGRDKNRYERDEEYGRYY